MSPGPSGVASRWTNLIWKPRSDCDFRMFVRAMFARTSRREAVPLRHERSIARATTFVASCVGSPNRSLFPLPGPLRYAAIALCFKSIGKNETYEPAIRKVSGSKRPSEPNRIAFLPAARSCCPKSCAFGASCQGM